MLEGETKRGDVRDSFEMLVTSLLVRFWNVGDIMLVHDGSAWEANRNNAAVLSQELNVKMQSIFNIFDLMWSMENHDCGPIRTSSVLSLKSSVIDSRLEPCGPEFLILKNIVRDSFSHLSDPLQNPLMLGEQLTVVVPFHLSVELLEIRKT